MKTKILFVLPAFTYGGTVFSTLNMISMLDKDKYDIKVFAMSQQGPVKERYAGIEILPEFFPVSALVGRLNKEKNLFRKSGFFCIKTISALARLVNIRFPDFIYKRASERIQKRYRFNTVASCQEGDSTYFARFFNNSQRVAWFRSEYSYYKRQLSYAQIQYEQEVYPVFDHIVCVSRTTRDDFVQFFPSLNNKIIDIHNIQNVADIVHKSLEPIDDGFNDSVFGIVSIGRIAPQKRFSHIPKIANDLKKMGCHFMWYIIGDGNVDGEYDRLVEEIQKNKVEDCVVPVGSRINPYPYIKASRLLVNTSSYEACPRVVIEAKIIKVPVVCANFSSAGEFVTNDFDGFIDTIENLSTPIASLVLEQSNYNRIKSNCDLYEADNDEIYNKLEKVLSYTVDV